MKVVMVVRMRTLVVYTGVMLIMDLAYMLFRMERATAEVFGRDLIGFACLLIYAHFFSVRASLPEPSNGLGG